MEPILLQTSEADAGTRLDACLARAIEDLTRSAAAKAVEDGRVLVNGKAPNKSYKLTGHEQIEFTPEEPAPIDAVPQDIPLDVVYEDDDVIVVNKPSGLVVHPAPGHPDGTLVNALLYHCGDSLSGVGGALRPGQSRLDELTSTAKIVESIVPTMMANGFNGIFLVATNPCDIITWQVWQLSGLPRSQVLGTGVWLDTTRLRRLLAQELEIGAQSIDAFILGEHGDTQFPVWSHSSVYGTPIADLYQQRTGLPLDREAMADKVRKLGFEIYAGKGCTEYGVAGTIAEICRNIFTGSHRALAVSCILDGEYGVSGAAAGVPAVLAQGGVKQIIELQLAGEEQAKFSQSIEVIKANIARLP